MAKNQVKVKAYPELLDTVMVEGDRTGTLREYLRALLEELWCKEECFSGKRPFGNSGWQYDVYIALARAGAISCETTTYPSGDVEHEPDEGAGKKLMLELIKLL